MKFGIIGEGNTDQIVIEQILKGYFSESKVDLEEVTWLQPVFKETGNWDKVCKYLASIDFQQAFQDVDFMVVHIDSDVFTKGEVKKRLPVDFTDKNDVETVDAIRSFLISQMTEEIYEIAKDRIVFAIAVNSVECWFVPIYQQDTSQINFVSDDCIATLYPNLLNKHGFVLKKKRQSTKSILDTW